MIALLGEASDASLPDSVRIVADTLSIGSSSGSTRFLNLRPGTYDVSLEGLEANCAVDGTRARTVTLVALDNRDIRFDVACTSGTGGGPQEPGYQHRATWTSLAGGEYALDIRIDMRTFNRTDIDDVTTGAASGDPITGAQMALSYDGSRLAYSRFEAPAPPVLNAEPTVNGSTSGFLTLLAVSTALRTGDMGIVRIIFTRVPNSPAGTVATSTTLEGVTSRSGGTTRDLTPDIRINEGTITLPAAGAGGGGGTNQAPIARANGPYTGTVNTPLVLSSTGTIDSDGTIASFSWSLGNGQTAPGASPSVTYASAGTYTVVLTATDNSGATDTDQTTVTITAGGTANLPPVARANGPYTATAGVAITLSSAGSSDSDGTIASYAWALGNGQTASGASPAVTLFHCRYIHRRAHRDRRQGRDRHRSGNRDGVESGRHQAAHLAECVRPDRRREQSGRDHGVVRHARATCRRRPASRCSRPSRWIP